MRRHSHAGMFFGAKEVIIKFISRMFVSTELFADLPQLERLQARTLRHDKNIVLTNQRKMFTDICYKVVNTPVCYYLYISTKTAGISICDTHTRMTSV